MTKSTSHSSEFAFRAPGVRHKMRLVLGGIGTIVLLSGCAVAPKPLVRSEMAEVVSANEVAVRSAIPPIAGALTLEEAIARALKFNLDHRVRMIEQAHAAGVLDASRFDQLPRMLANAGYVWRDEENVRRAIDSVTGAPSLANPHITTERAHGSWDIGLSWNLLDFGASYYTAHQNADRLMIASERRRKAMHQLIQQVRAAYWRALAAQRLSAKVREAIGEAETALVDARKLEVERVRAPVEALRYQRNLVETLRLLESVERELAGARIELASLIGERPTAPVKLADMAEKSLPPLQMAVDRMEQVALFNNADLRESFYHARIAATETRKAVLRLMPGLSFDYAYRGDDDKYLVNQHWQDAAVRVSFNLFNLLAAPSAMRSAERGKQVAEARRMALQMAVLTQLHLARHQYDESLRQFGRADELWRIDRALAEQAVKQERSETIGRQERISLSVTAILSEVRRYHALAKAHESAGRVQATLGLEPDIEALDDVELGTLAERLKEALESWDNLQESKEIFRLDQTLTGAAERG